MGSPATFERIFCATSPGLEGLLCEELRELGLRSAAERGGALAEGEDAAARACLASRLADAVHLRLWEGPSKDLVQGKRIAARRAGALPLLVRAREDPATVSIDAAGSPLFRRGWRARIGQAPLRETLAAGLLRAGGFRGETPFVDPMCGSGTIAIEAALIARGSAPGLHRPLALEALQGHDPAHLERLRRTLENAERKIKVPIFASDKNAGALRLARKNALAAGVEDSIRFTRCDAREAPLPEGSGLCAVNPPYGERIEEEREAWLALGALFLRLGGFEAAVLGPGKGEEKLLPASPRSTLAVRNGGLSCTIFRYRL